MPRMLRACELPAWPGQAGDASHGRRLPRGWEAPPTVRKIAVGKACAGKGGRPAGAGTAGTGLGAAVFPPDPSRKAPRGYGRAGHAKRNEVERLFRRLKGFRRLFPRFGKPGVIHRLPALRPQRRGPRIA